LRGKKGKYGRETVKMLHVKKKKKESMFLNKKTKAKCKKEAWSRKEGSQHHKGKKKVKVLWGFSVCRKGTWVLQRGRKRWLKKNNSNVGGGRSKDDSLKWWERKRKKGAHGKTFMWVCDTIKMATKEEKQKRGVPRTLTLVIYWTPGGLRW